VFPGRSLARYWSDAQSPETAVGEAILSEVRHIDRGKDWYPVAKGDMYSVMDDHHHYIRNGDGREELYRLSDDPREERDLSRSLEAREVIVGFRRELERLWIGDRGSGIGGFGAPIPGPRSPIPDPRSLIQQP
jgi:hypothetical protein